MINMWISLNYRLGQDSNSTGAGIIISFIVWVKTLSAEPTLSHSSVKLDSEFLKNVKNLTW